jgi:type III restriction enzyme
MLKSQKINDSKEFYEEFYRNLNKLKAKELKSFIKTKIQILKEAMNYFIEKDATLELLKNSIVDSFSKEKTIIMNGNTDNNIKKQLLVNSLEDKSNPIRLIFTVDMLNEGWDVLNLFDIVRLYDTRQGSGVAGKVGNYTIKDTSAK